ncbi:hypothetical protein NB703_004457 [Pantoea ananatis]|uniref:Pycsar effector protein domain-containing protein n=1 Tax=Pantoea ananas TaxID=553 RepID=A0AAJ1FTC2_PANAN|nr:hypothetical protein [Pantoea ananatis]MCW0346364.1 hypothetical protein [Pantoea ananatis]
MKEKQIEFLYQSINDTQATIRAIDVKIGFLFVIIFLPLTSVEGLSKSVAKLWTSPYHLGALSVITALLWLASVYVLFKSLSPITDIKKHMIGTVPADTFYMGGMPLIGIKDFFNISDIRASQDVQTFLSALPQDEQKLLAELASEKMKVSLIRNVKNLRVNVCTNLTLGWLSVGMFLSTVYYFNYGVQP